MFEITIRTFYRWRATHKEFTAACEIGKAFADERVTASLYQRVCGYEYNAERVFMFSQWEKPLIVRYAKRVIGDPRMALHWLRVRQAAKWRIPKDDGGKGDLAEILAAALARVAEGRDPHGDD
uniref:hypothetical protein n=1 Tax=Sphingomonas bacterium TaxID=1895847 RepID=UPI00262FA2D9|nr:hypothetical protein [Sphingomonas bacterium]